VLPSFVAKNCCVGGFGSKELISESLLVAFFLSAVALKSMSNPIPVLFRSNSSIIFPVFMRTYGISILLCLDEPFATSINGYYCIYYYCSRIIGSSFFVYFFYFYWTFSSLGLATGCLIYIGLEPIVVRGASVDDP